LLFAGRIAGAYLLSWEAETEAVTLRHPQSGHVVQCGPDRYLGGLGKNARRQRNHAKGMLHRCLDHNLEGGYQRVTG
jgi:hypothetical protein